MTMKLSAYQYLVGPCTENHHLGSSPGILLQSGEVPPPFSASVSLLDVHNLLSMPL